MSKISQLADHRKPSPTTENAQVTTPKPPKYAEVREREYLTPDEVALDGLRNRNAFTKYFFNSISFLNQCAYL